MLPIFGLQEFVNILTNLFLPSSGVAPCFFHALAKVKSFPCLVSPWSGLPLFEIQFLWLPFDFSSLMGSRKVTIWLFYYCYQDRKIILLQLKWNQDLYVFFTQLYVFRIHLCYCMELQVIYFPGCIIFYYVNIASFIHFLVNRHLGCFYLFIFMNSLASNTLIHTCWDTLVSFSSSYSYS